MSKAKLTVSLDPGLVTDARELLPHTEHESLSALVERALREYVIKETMNLRRLRTAPIGAQIRQSELVSERFREMNLSEDDLHYLLDILASWKPEDVNSALDSLEKRRNLEGGEE